MSSVWDKGLVLSVPGSGLTTSYTYSQPDPTQSSPLKYSGQSRRAGFYVRIVKAALGSMFKTITLALEAAYQDLPIEYAKVLTLLHLGGGSMNVESVIPAPAAGLEMAVLLTCPYLQDTIAKHLRLGVKADAMGVDGDLVEVRAVLW